MSAKHRLAVATVMALLVGAGCGKPPGSNGAKQGSAAEANVKRAGASATYASLMTELDKRITGLTTLAQKRPGDWVTRMHLASALLERAGLTNSFDDYDRIQKVLDEAFAIAPSGSGPLMVAARFNFSIHRLDKAEAYLDQMDHRALQKTDEHTSARVLRAQIALQRGQYDDGFGMLLDLVDATPTATTELALYYAKTGDRAEAESMLEEALANTPERDPRLRAWTRLQLGVIALDHGDYELALDRFDAADAELPGWWMVGEHRAQVHNILGDIDEAVSIYKDVLHHGHLPQDLDRLAHCYEHGSRTDEARDVVQQADAAWEAALARYPEAAMGHGLDHYMRYGTPEKALELAKANYANRPGGEAQVALAKALLKANEPAKALEVVSYTLATPYDTAGLHDVAAQAHSALKHAAEAEQQLTLLAAINPRYRGDEHTH